ncbi:DUF4129 domain-containing protein [Leifsonia sp. 21MFCrub1.1]|uniref:DUF4129 domain-containing protein n=1 Tax=Leifsonia sp. 21MFCrub1.1 TaxID=1798223 RepID=UPI00089299F8|nr:DUF4129 domain-containing protein [Leifsonia sp. 21MFCrub1.1]SEA78710.1 protein of unknown function [Leifsonia sp. 21MFCrub1.1]
MTTKTGGRRRWTLAVGVVLAAVVLVAVAFQGAPRFSGPRMFLPPAPVRSQAPAPQQSGSPEPRGVPHEVRIDLSWLLVALVILAVVIGLALLWRLRRRAAPPLELPPLETVGVAETSETHADQGPEPEPEQVRRGLERAAEVLAEPREPRDAIEAAWVGLEEGAADSGVRRLPAETPAEFAARVVARVAADRDAASRFLALYLRARFSSAPVTAADVAAARAAVEALRASWSVGSAAGSRARDGGRG